MTKRVKREPVVERIVVSPSPGPSPSLPSNPMGPPSPAPSRQRIKTRKSEVNNPSIAPSFVRSHAPSAETYQPREDTDDPIFMEMRNKRGSFNEGSPASASADTSFAQQSFAHPSFKDIGMKLRACNDTLGDLQQLGVSHVAALPELVLVGDQSAGKSSLMSGLARVSLPRSAGVCTRCPLHIRLIGSNNSHWSCTVSLQQDYDFRPPPGGTIKKSDVTATNPFPPWVKKPHRDIKMFKTIFNPAEIEEVLRWAQVAVLNHNRSHELFIPGEGSVAKDTDLASAASDTDAQFSPNIVALEIKGPGLPDLSFYDLPGVFLSPDQSKDAYVVEVVKNLTRHYIRREKAIIMWALPMNADPENSISLGIIRDVDAVDRTIGIITKADKLASDDDGQWLAMFRGEKYNVGHGFFATSRPPGKTLEEASRWEDAFFRREYDAYDGWPAEFGEFTARCGVELLREYISVQLGNAFSRSLPSIKSKIFQRLRLIESQLNDLPELPANVEHEVKRSLHNFLQRMKQVINETEFSSHWNCLNEQFQSCIHKMKPTCRVKDDDLHTIDLSDADTEASAVTPSKRPRVSDSTVRATPSKRQRQDMLAPNTPVKNEDFASPATVRPSPAPAADVVSPFARYFNLGRLAMDIKDIRSDIMNKKTPGMPSDLVPVEVRVGMCMDAVRKWQLPLEMYIDKTAELLEQVSNQALEKSLGTMRRRLIFKQCKAYLKEFLDEAIAGQRGRLSDKYEEEIYRPYIMNEKAFAQYKANEMEQLLRARALHRLKAVALIGWDYTIKRVEEMTEEKKLAERNLLATHLPKIGKDPYATEMEVAGWVRGYYVMAAMRFVEGVTMNVNATLFRTIVDSGLDFFMNDKLGVFGKADINVYNQLMEEDEQTAKLREQLKREMEKLSRAMASINALEGSGSNEATYRGEEVQASIIIDSNDTMDEGVF